MWKKLLSLSVASVLLVFLSGARGSNSDRVAPAGNVLAQRVNPAAINTFSPTGSAELFDPATPDRLAVTVYRNKGGVWFSSKWDGSKTVEKNIKTGNVAVQ